VPVRASRRLSRVLLVVGSVAVATLAAEMLARLAGVGPRFGQLIFVRGVPTRSVDGVALWSDRHPRYDSEDVRRMAGDPDAFTIVGLGDSIMYGVGQSKEDTYLEQARRVLAERSARGVEILNLAVPGYNTMQEDAVYKEIADRISPDLVLVHYWVDDAHQYRVVAGHVVDFGKISDDGRFVVRALPLPAALSDFLLVHSRLYDLLTQAVVSFRRRAQSDDWTRVARPLADIQARAERAGARLVVLASPDLNGPSPRPNDDLERLRQLAANRGFEVIDLSTWVSDASSPQIAQRDGYHFNAEGHRRIGERLAEYLLQHDLKDAQH
jgi:lysophospholipase L1-like esterase